MATYNRYSMTQIKNLLLQKFHGCDNIVELGYLFVEMFWKDCVLDTSEGETWLLMVALGGGGKQLLSM